ncbi:MAG: RelA/SpoT domain-containing protein [Lachnospiraceae bacterium]|nr:RelA/SpoT domain-containing protein [Lachnospiraceae bacterium]
MKYTAKQITKAGEVLTTSKDKDAVVAATKKINDWRELHLPVIEKLMMELRLIFANTPIVFDFSSYRLKRMTSIQYKLDFNPQMGLGGMQDIAGGRFVFSDIKNLLSAYSLLQKQVPSYFELVKEDDYVSAPKESGYRSIHLVYRYHSESEEDWDKMKVEIQLRTKLQHSWAMAVETAGLVTNTAMKSGQGSDEWQLFFHLVSCLFATREHTQKLAKYSNEPTISIIDKLQKLNNKYKFSDQLLALNFSFKVVERKAYQGEMYLLYINFKTKQLSISSFEKESSDVANTQYNRLENRIKDGENAVVLVSVSDFKELKEAYPSYFLDMEDFNNVLMTYLSVGKKRPSYYR